MDEFIFDCLFSVALRVSSALALRCIIHDRIAPKSKPLNLSSGRHLKGNPNKGKGLALDPKEVGARFLERACVCVYFEKRKSALARIVRASHRSLVRSLLASPIPIPFPLPARATLTRRSLIKRIERCAGSGRTHKPQENWV